MEKILISSYRNVTDKIAKDTPLMEFLNNIKNGKWQDQVLKVRTIEDKSERAKAKQSCPLVTVSGSFEERKDNKIRKHSGFIAIDLDDIEANQTKKLLESDSYVFAAFTSIGGKGLCVLFKIDGDKHFESFEGIETYLYNTYQIIVDKSGKNISRARFVSYDPYLYLNESALKFKKYLPKKKPKKQNRVVVVKTDFDEIIKQMYSRGLNICEDYQEWVSTAYALISEFGEAGRDYFHTLSSISNKYSTDDTDKQFDNCLRNHSTSKSKISTIGSIYYAATQAGIETYSQETKTIVRIAASQVKSGITDTAAINKTLVEYHNITDAEPIIKQVIDNGIEYNSENEVEDIVDFLRPYGLRKNEITRNIELKGKPIDDTVLNSLFLDCKSIYSKITKDLVYSVVFSNRIDVYNPIKDLFSAHDIRKEYPNLQLLIDSIKTDTVNHDVWVTKWLVSIIASAYGKHSPLMLVLAGELQGTGKTHWFRYLLPQKIQNLFAESKMDGGKDDEILMTKKLIILDDEFGGKSKREEKKLKEITSKQWINVREPYGRVSVDLRRLAMFCGTTNDVQILNDPTGNRRILPVHVKDIDHTVYNKCDKDELFQELYSLYKSGYDYTILKNEIELLNNNTAEFKQSSVEEELILNRMAPGDDTYGEWLNITSIILYITADTNYRLSNTKVGMVLTSLGFKKKRAKVGGAVITVYCVSKTASANEEEEEPLF